MKTVDVHALRAELEAGPCQLLDVREYPEFAHAHVPGARLMPMRDLARRAADLDRGRPVTVICQAGVRSRKAAELLEALGHGDVRQVQGGLLAWQAAGFGIQQAEKLPWPLERQVRLTAGLIVAVSSLLALLLSPWFAAISAFVGGGLAFAAATNTCAMAMLIARLPSNRGPESLRRGDVRQAA